MRPGDASKAMRHRGGNFDAWEGNGRITTFPEMLLIRLDETVTSPRCSSIMVGSVQLFDVHLVLAELVLF
jgi:hypothetical protein